MVSEVPCVCVRAVCRAYVGAGCGGGAVSTDPYAPSESMIADANEAIGLREQLAALVAERDTLAKALKSAVVRELLIGKDYGDHEAVLADYRSALAGLPVEDSQ